MASDEKESVVDDDLTTFDFEDQDDLEFDDDDAPAGSDNGSAESSNSSAPEANASSDDSDESKDSGDKPAKRRRRRRRRSSGRDKGDSNQPSGKKNQGRQQKGGGGGGSGGGRGGQQQQRKGKFARNAPPPPEAVTSGVIEGVLELHPKGYGFLRDKDNDYGARETDAFVSSTFVEKHQLREGIMIRGEVGPGSRGQGPRLLSIDTIDGGSIEDYEQIKHFETLTPINPFEQIKLEIGAEPITMRVMDLLTPIGKGQRALIVAPPRSGKTMLLQDIANSVSINHPEIHLIVLLIDERPEEVTELRRMVRGEVIASSMDRDVESHVRISQLIHERGKRLAEAGKDCFILMDSITRTARAFNKWVGNSGRTGTGGLDVKAMDIPRKMFGTARRFDEGGSLTVAATALIDTGSRMDEAIFQEFKGTGNMELVLSRDLADRRIWPAIDISKSGTRREEKILAPEVLDGVIMLRRALVSMSPVDAMTELTRKLQMFPTNSEFLERVRSVL
ncbi:hypothetical protein Mal4_44380 [Maioricimonas rarisocia]|uniref:Transcription termination factor Rho n=1 Tax=Maioricimonas rarisocia TaxID=2528026 RepID=A0A517ZC51_9PLAN|nr:transcription termination factor Rho [Maioricimonas rarisocia]QDU40084.1 hypothetical protein Mal4_44380 [Maioricimonas rarisocia]